MPTTTITDRAIVQNAYGAVDVFNLTQVARPEIADDEVLLRVHAAGLGRDTGTS